MGHYEKWKCDKCGACCEIIPKIFGFDCRHYDKDKKLCLIYENRPEICRTNVNEFNNNLYNSACNDLRERIKRQKI